MPTGDAGLRIVLKREAVLKGTVVDAQTKKPIEKFSAFLSNDDNKQQPWRQQRWGGQQSDPQGKFRVQAPQGTYRLEILANGYVRARKEGISLQPGTEPEPVAIEMKRGGAIEGIVRGHDRPARAGGADLRRQGGRRRRLHGHSRSARTTATSSSAISTRGSTRSSSRGRRRRS